MSLRNEAIVKIKVTGGTVIKEERLKNWLLNGLIV